MRLQAIDVGRRTPGADRWLLRDVSLTVVGGERVAVVGPNGAGKSLLLRALALLDPLDAGEVRWEDAPVTDADVPTFRRRVLYLAQRPALLDDTVESDLKRPFRLAVARGGYERDRVMALLEPLGRDAAFLAKPTAEVSGGEAQIAAFVRALQLDPTILLLDEPTAALDSDATAALERLVDRWVEGGPRERAFVWVSHDPSQANRVAGRTVRLEQGRLAA